MRTAKRSTAFLLTFLMVLGFLPGLPGTNLMASASPPKAGSNGFIAPIDDNVPSNVVRIRTAAELAAIGGVQNTGIYYVLENDINLTAEWVPIDNFHGTFDGRGFTINNLFILNSSNRQIIGLFTQAEETATIKNVGVNIGLLGVAANRQDNSGIGVNDLLSAGGLVGINNGATILNCYVSGNVSAFIENKRGVSTSSAGGLIGRSNGGTITNCYATGNINASAINSNLGGGFYSSAGGLIGISIGSIITNSYATGNINASTHNNQYGDVNSYAGGLIGRGNGCAITNCYSTGNINSSSNYNRDSSLSSAGGLIGEFTAGTITYSFASGEVSSDTTSRYSGGLIGLASNSIISNSYATGRVFSSRYAGGLIGFVESGTITITDSYSTSTVISESLNDHGSWAGGLIAYIEDNTNMTLVNTFQYAPNIVGENIDSIGTPPKPETKTINATFGSPVYILDGVPFEAQAFTYNGVAYLPAAFLARKLGIEAVWHASTNITVLTSGAPVDPASAVAPPSRPAGARSITATFGAPAYILDGKPLTEQAITYDGVAYLPAAYFARTLGLTAVWDGVKNVTNLTSK